MNEWINVKDGFPPFMEFVEVISKDLCLAEIGRMFAVYVQCNEGNYWTRAGMNEDEWSDNGFQITHWKQLSPDPKNKKPYLEIDKKSNFKVVIRT